MDAPVSSSREHFDLLRVVAALLVFAGHQRALEGLPEPAFLGIMSWGGVGVAIFFSLSGYLVSESWRRDPHFLRYMQRRALRLVPGLTAVVLFTVFVLGPIHTVLPMADYFASGQTWEYLMNIGLNIRFALPGVFAQAPVAGVMNGSLWTLPMEVGCYLGVALMLTILPRLAWRSGSWVIAVTLWAVDIVVPMEEEWVFYATNWRIGLHFGVYFAIGVALRVAPIGWVSAEALAILAATVLMFSANSRLGYVLSSICVPLCVLGIARMSARPSTWLSKHGDLSYGLYLYAFPIQQTVVAAGIAAASPSLAMLCAFLATVFASYLSWHLVEAPALRWKPSRPPANTTEIHSN